MSLETFENDPIDWAEVACGSSHMAALSKDGNIFTWGEGRSGQLGHGDSETKETPTKVESLIGKKIIKVACGAHHTVALTDQGELYSW